MGDVKRPAEPTGDYEHKTRTRKLGGHWDHDDDDAEVTEPRKSWYRREEFHSCQMKYEMDRWAYLEMPRGLNPFLQLWICRIEPAWTIVNRYIIHVAISTRVAGSPRVQHALADPRNKKKRIWCLSNGCDINLVHAAMIYAYHMMIHCVVAY